MVPTLSNKDQVLLAERGISVESGVYGVKIKLISNGLCWLLNYLHSSGKQGSLLSLKLLKDVAAFQKDSDSWRELRIAASRLPAYDTQYYQLSLYLNGSPPKAFMAFPPNLRAVPRTFDIPHLEYGIFKIKGDQAANIALSASETELLENDGVIVADGVN
ncbi:hypothetical protein [Marinospirillum sp.]|uniref:hypothetical protein n=1 Tax=Marinospirillum sp. TaxID=2183934 RepID=UPI003850FCA3